MAIKFDAAAGGDGCEDSVKRLLDLRRHFHGKTVQALPKLANILQKLIIEDNGGDRRSKSRGGGHQGLRNARSDRAEAGGSRASKAGKRVDDAPNGAEKADERADRAGRGQPGHAFFRAANFFGGGKLHAYSDSLQAFQMRWMRVRGGAGNLRLQLAITGGINGSKRRACRRQGLRIGNAARGAKDAKELLALPANSAEHPPLLENHRPGNDGKKKKNQKNGARDPSRLLENTRDVGRNDNCEQKNDGHLSEG